MGLRIVEESSLGGTRYAIATDNNNSFGGLLNGEGEFYCANELKIWNVCREGRLMTKLEILVCFGFSQTKLDEIEAKILKIQKMHKELEVIVNSI